MNANALIAILLSIVYATCIVAAENISPSRDSQNPLEALLCDRTKENPDLEYDNSEQPGLVALKWWHDAVVNDEIRLTWLIDGKARIQQRSEIRLYDSETLIHQYAHDWAHQNMHSVYLRAARVDEIRDIVRKLPRSSKTPKISNLFVVSIKDKEGVSTFIYDRVKLPSEIHRLCLLAGVNVDIAPLP